ncbi:centrosomal protein 15 [Engraulis encrasicolus]|uniref:centrosomal protein 15 n=1 Tax=Engraulis encrasicolus TaxID=184585 RepID=UPI002FD08AC4
MHEDFELVQKHEDILGKRTALLDQMEMQRQQQRAKRKQQKAQSKAARERNTQLLEDLDTLENKLRMKQAPHPDFLTLETCYWASVEEQLPAWEPFLLGRGPAPLPCRPCQSPSRRRPDRDAPHSSSTVTHNTGLPPRPKKKPATAAAV